MPTTYGVRHRYELQIGDYIGKKRRIPGEEKEDGGTRQLSFPEQVNLAVDIEDIFVGQQGYSEA